MDQISIILLIVFLIAKAAETMAMSRAGAAKRTMKFEWTVFLIRVLYYLVLATAILEHLWLRNTPNLLVMGIGGLLFAAAAIISVKGYLDLGSDFSMHLAKGSSKKMPRNGLYRFIRHPVYLGNLMFFVACPTFMGARLTWIVAVAGLVGILIRIREEEKTLRKSIKDYKVYMQETWALIPGIF